MVGVVVWEVSRNWNNVLETNGGWMEDGWRMDGGWGMGDG